MVRAVEAWLDAFATVLRHPLPDEGTSLTLGEPVSLRSGEAAWPATRLVWLPAAGAAFGLFDLPSRGRVNAVLPLPAQAWLRAHSDAEITPIPGSEALATEDAWQGIDRFQFAALAQLRSVLDQADDEAAERTARRHAYEAELRASTYSGFVGIFGGEHRAQAVGHPAGDLLAAMQAVGAAQHVGIVSPSARAIASATDPIDAIARASGVRVREIRLELDWWHADTEPFVGTLAADGAPVAVVPARRFGGYEILDAQGHRARVTPATAALLAPTGTMLYRSLPSRALRGVDLTRFALTPLRRELLWLGLFSLAGAALALVPPIVTDYLFADVVPGLDASGLAWMVLLLVIAAFAGLGFALAQRFAAVRIQSKATHELQAAIWNRLISLPLPFFRRFSSGDLTFRANVVERIQKLVTEAFIAAVLALPAGIASLVMCFVLDVRLGIFGLIAILLVSGLVLIALRLQMPYMWASTGAGQLFAVSLELLGGLAKLRVANAHDRAFAKWGERFAFVKKHWYRAQLSFVWIMAFVAGGPAIGVLFLLIGASTLEPGALEPARFLAFNTAFIAAMSSFTALAVVGTTIAYAIPVYAEMRPILAEVHESGAVHEDPGELRGEIEVDQVSMRYAPHEPLVLSELSFTAAPGEFVALVGPSGAGKSSVLRLLLGFESAELGSVRYDGREIESLDRTALRRQMGVVIQSAKVLPGDILSNIVGMHHASIDEAWEAARVAGLADDIRAMPMGMHTSVGEGGASFSGGQRQRLLIARAVVGRPSILLFDEATSALDGRTQAAVSTAIERMRATRIVIAHRLSTIRSADKILVVEHGRIVQSGTHDELIDVDGTFRRLALRQIA